MALMSGRKPHSPACMYKLILCRRACLQQNHNQVSFTHNHVVAENSIYNLLFTASDFNRTQEDSAFEAQFSASGTLLRKHLLGKELARSGNYFRFDHNLCYCESFRRSAVACLELISGEREQCSNNLVDDRELYSAPVGNLLNKFLVVHGAPFWIAVVSMPESLGH